MLILDFAPGLPKGVQAGIRNGTVRSWMVQKVKKTGEFLQNAMIPAQMKSFP